jgi:hypothetical protein
LIKLSVGFFGSDECDFFLDALDLEECLFDLLILVGAELQIYLFGGLQRQQVALEVLFADQLVVLVFLSIFLVIFLVVLLEILLKILLVVLDVVFLVVLGIVEGEMRLEVLRLELSLIGTHFHLYCF